MSLEFGKVLHVGIVVRDLEKAVEIYEKELGIGPFVIEDPRPFFEDKIVNDGKGLNIRTAILRKDGYEIELVTPVGPGVYADWLEKKGPGLHHIKFETPKHYTDIVETCEKISGRKPYLDIKFPNGIPLVAYADLLEEAGLLIEAGGNE